MNKILALLRNLISVTGVFLLLTVLCLIWNIWISARGDGAIPLIKNAVVITDGKVLPENEGRLVLVSGKVTAHGSTTTDPVFELTVASPYLRRKVAKYHWYKPTEDRYGYYDWLQEKNDCTINKDGSIDTRFATQSGWPYQDQIFYSTAKIGEFELSPDHLHKLQSSMVRVTGLKPGVAEKLGIQALNDIEYHIPVNKNSKGYHDGDFDIYFRMLDMSKVGDVTILAKQEGSKLTYYTYGGSYSISELYNGIVSRSEILAEEESDAIANKIITGVVTGIFASITVILFIRKIRRKRR